MLVNEVRSAPQELREKISKATGGDAWNLPWPLPNMKPVEATDFWGWRSSYGFKGEIWAGSKEVEVDGKREHATVLVYWVDHSRYAGGGFAVAVTHRYKQEKVLYFDWRACDHQFRGRNTGKCLHEYTCEKCGYSYEVDSSG